MVNYGGIDNLDPIYGTVNEVHPQEMKTPYSGNWWMTSVISGIPESSVGWLVAQGWQITGTSVSDGVTYYSLARQSMQNWMILQKLLYDYTFAYNEGRGHNAQRYNELINNYNLTVQATRGTLNEIADVSEAHVTIHLTQIESLLGSFKTECDNITNEADDVKDVIDAQLALYLTKLNTIDGDFTTHRTTVRALLTDLGTTELARINEKFDNLLEKAKQNLLDRGMYSAALYSNYETRVERERNEAIADLNDRLNREKLQNEHTLWNELMQMNQAVLQGRSMYNEAQMGKTRFLVDVKHRIALSLMQARMEQANARLGIRDREEKLMAYQLDTRNNIAMALYGFVERREDTYPGLETITRLVAGLGDSGGGWVTP